MVEIFLSNFAKNKLLMLQNIHIQNFRCFEDFEASGFKRVNLIGGKNNSGKTCLLEGIQCIDRNLLSIAQQRGQKSFLSFSNFNVNSSEIKIAFRSDKNYKTSIILPSGLSDSDYERKGDRVEMKIQYIKGEIHNPEFTVGEIIDKFQFLDPNPSIESLVEILKIIEPKAEGLLSWGFPEYKLAITVSNQSISINDFGDGLKYLLNYFISFIVKKQIGDITESILLIDEIENGIHYSAHYDLWKNIFKLSQELNVQVFATTHSLEMITAFNEVAKEEGEGAYFEMFRNVEDDKIKCIKHETDILE